MAAGHCKLYCLRMNIGVRIQRGHGVIPFRDGYKRCTICAYYTKSELPRCACCNNKFKTRNYNTRPNVRKMMLETKHRY